MVKLTNINLIVYDFDGVMTDNKFYLSENGSESVKLSRADGLGIAEIKKLGKEQLILSTEKNIIVKKRAEKLQIDCIQGVFDKKQELEKFIKSKEIQLKNILYIGNDINDLEVMHSVGLRLCPSDAHPIIISISDIVLESKGGEGVVRGLFDRMIKE